MLVQRRAGAEGDALLDGRRDEAPGQRGGAVRFSKGSILREVLVVDRFLPPHEPLKADVAADILVERIVNEIEIE